MSLKKMALTPGQIVAGAYRVDSLMEAGGYAEVFLASRLADGMPVAIKALRLDVEHGDPAAPERFAREAAMVAHLEHPNLVRILDFGRINHLALFMVMERLEGANLESLLYKSALAPGRVWHILCQILDALVVAHGQGAVHRDLKPSNIFLCPVANARPGDPVDWVKILDFGFARGISKTLGKELRRTLTLDGAIVGTPGYVAPELLQKGGRLTPLVDLYAVGVIGHEMLTGAPAFPGEGLERASLQVTSEPAEPPEEIADTDLYKTVRRLMARDPLQRTQSAEAALAELRALGDPPGRLWG
ncbi:MAG: serine/threonine-protein kinase [Polyangia bacterium]|jgi:serine/threonine-protein kinase|nr:serine/threonine-protein kinase [Polyangia bacterium]